MMEQQALLRNILDELADYGKYKGTALLGRMIISLSGRRGGLSGRISKVSGMNGKKQMWVERLHLRQERRENNARGIYL